MDLRRLREQAAKLSADGRYERAEVLYRQLLTHAPRDHALWLKHAEVLKRLAHVDDAITSYRMSAQLLLDLGHGQRAVACLKIALELRPGDVDLVSDIIRYELRLRREAAADSLPPPNVPKPTQREVDAWAATDAPPPAPLLALPMFTSTESRIAALVSDLEPPAPKPSAPRVPLEVEAPLQTWPQVRRISDHEIAVKPGPTSHWVVMTSSAPIEVRFFEEYEVSEHALWLEEPTS